MRLARENVSRLCSHSTGRDTATRPPLTYVPTTLKATLQTIPTNLLKHRKLNLNTTLNTLDANWATNASDRATGATVHAVPFSNYDIFKISGIPCKLQRIDATHRTLAALPVDWNYRQRPLPAKLAQFRRMRVALANRRDSSYPDRVTSCPSFPGQCQSLK